MEEEIDIKMLLKYFWDRKIIILCILLGCFLVLNIYFLVFTKSLYSNTIRVRISTEATTSKLSAYNDLLLTNTLIKDSIKDSGVNASVSEIKDNLSISANIGSKIYTITLNYKNKTDGKLIIDSIINQFILKVKSYDGNNVAIYDNVVTSDKPINYNLFKNEIMYLVISVILSLGYVAIVYFLDFSIKSPIELNKYNVLGSMDDVKNKNNINLIKTKIKLNNLGPIIFINTARKIDCEKQIYALMKEFSKDSKTLLIDTNTRNNKLKGIGYTDLLKKYNSNFSKYIHTKDGFFIMTPGTINSDVEILLSNNNNKKFLNDLKKEYDYIFLYNSDVIDYSDALIISKLSDANYTLVELNVTDKRDFEKLINVYKQVDSKVDGIIVVDNE